MSSGWLYSIDNLELPGLPTLGRLSNKLQSPNQHIGFYPMVLINDEQFAVWPGSGDTILLVSIIASIDNPEWLDHLEQLIIAAQAEGKEIAP